MIIGLSTYVGEYENLLNDVPTDIRDLYRYSFSFGIGWVAAELHILSAAALGVGIKFTRDDVISTQGHTVNIKDRFEH